MTQDPKSVGASGRYPPADLWSVDAKRRIGLGVLLLKVHILSAVLFGLAVGVLGGVLGGIAAGSGQASPLTRPEVLLGLTIVSNVFGVANAALFGLGCWRLSAPLEDAAPDGLDAPRRAFRICSLVWLGVYALGIVVGLTTRIISGPANGSFTALEVVSFSLTALSLLAYATWYGFFGWHASHIAEAFEQPKLRRKAERFIWLGPLLGTIGFIPCGLGALIGLIILYNMLVDLRKAATSDSKQQAEPLPIA